MIKIYAVFVGDVFDVAFADKAIAHDWASRYTDTDGIKISVVAYVPAVGLQDAP